MMHFWRCVQGPRFTGVVKLGESRRKGHSSRNLESFLINQRARSTFLLSL